MIPDRVQAPNLATPENVLQIPFWICFGVPAHRAEKYRLEPAGSHPRRDQEPHLRNGKVPQNSQNSTKAVSTQYPNSIQTVFLKQKKRGGLRPPPRGGGRRRCPPRLGILFCLRDTVWILFGYCLDTVLVQCCLFCGTFPSRRCESRSRRGRLPTGSNEYLFGPTGRAPETVPKQYLEYLFRFARFVPCTRLGKSQPFRESSRNQEI